VFEQALEAEPDGVDALVGLAYVELDRGKLQEAVAAFKQALAKDGSNARAEFGLAESYRQLGNGAAALTGFKRFLKLQPSGSDADMARQLIRELAP
jgi:tetratricopeptide (TPR) repeat protein